MAKPPSVAIRSLHNVINRYLARDASYGSGRVMSGGNIDIITYPRTPFGNEEIFPQDVERRFGITRSTSMQSARIDGTQRAYRARIRCRGTRG